MKRTYNEDRNINLFASSAHWYERGELAFLEVGRKILADVDPAGVEPQELGV